MAKKKEEEVFFIGIREPREVRKDLLESLKDSIEILKAYEDFKNVRIRKVELLTKLKEVMRQIDLTMNKLKILL